ncbi:hypothetical protein LCGC14_1513700 [marine sediment metagenome]|uniref:Nucleoside 2-deoxyribosyltransferase n=1 Tax=marine sediment metagenome TaxID=412755 RepID=A0A0F9M1S0_9ZZZZ
MRVYISHSIRGKHGINATKEQMERNNELAKSFSRLIKNYFIHIDFYVPGDHDEFVLIAYDKKYLTEAQILSVDCEIVDRCNFVIALVPDGYMSRGMRIEADYAAAHGIPVLIVDGFTKETVDTINGQLARSIR